LKAYDANRGLPQSTSQIMSVITVFGPIVVEEVKTQLGLADELKAAAGCRILCVARINSL